MHEKSVINHELTTSIIASLVKNLNIDKEGTLRMRGRKESDQHTITYEVTGKIIIKKKFQKKMDMANKQ